MSSLSTSSWADFSSTVKASRVTASKKQEQQQSSSSFARRGKKGCDDDQKEWKEVLGKRDKKLPAFLRPAPDVQNRSERHDRRTTSSWAKTPSSELEHVRASLEKKAKLYEQLQRGKTAGLSEDRIRDSLIDWDRKEIDETKEELADSAHTDDEGEMTDYEDEFGRSRRVKRSEVPRYAIDAQRRKQEESHDDSLVTYGPATSFPVFRPDPSRTRDQTHTSSGYKRAAPDHFDSSADKRYRGAGFYEFSQDEAQRAQQMDNLRKARQETDRSRAGK